MKIKNILFAILIMLWLQSCSTLNIAELSKPSNLQQMDSLNLKTGYELYKLRIDLIRNTTTETVGTSSGRNASTTTQTVDVPYHFLGVYLFDGVFLDLNNNLSVNVIHLLNNNGDGDFEIRQKTKFKEKSPFTYAVTRQGNSATCEQKSLIGKNISDISFSDNKVTIEGKGLSRDQDIILNPNGIVYDPHGIFGKLSRTEIVKTNYGLIVPRFGKDIEFTQPYYNTIELDRNTTVKSYGDKIEFIYTGLFGSKTIYTLLKLKDGYVFYDKKKRGVRIKLINNQVFVEENGKIINYFELDEPSY